MAIKHIWITDSAPAGRLLILRIYFDGRKAPAVEVPLADFFASANYNEYRQINSLPICVNPLAYMETIQSLTESKVTGSMSALICIGV